jgi:hypothetical protein
MHLTYGNLQQKMEKMNKSIKIFSISIVFLTITSILNNCLANNKDSLFFEVLLTKKMYNDVGLFEKPIQSIDISKSQLISISTSNQFCLIGWGGIKPVGKKSWGTISSFAISPEGLLMAIRNNELCYMDSLGSLVKLFKLPNQNMKISAGKYLMYVYDGNTTKEKKAIYAISHGGKYTKLFEISEPINAIAETDNGIYLTCQNAILKYDFKLKTLKTIVLLQNKKEIKSLTIDTINDRIYFATDSIIYTYKNSKSGVISDKISGILKYFGNGLIVFNTENQTLIRIIGLENKISQYTSTTTKTIEPQAAQTSTITSIAPTPITTKTIEPQVTQTSTIAPVATSSIATTVSVTTNTASPTRQPTKELLNNQDIIKMVKAKVSNNLIINIIKTSDANFDLKIESIIFLSNQGVSSDIIAEMKNAMDTKNGNK